LCALSYAQTATRYFADEATGHFVKDHEVTKLPKSHRELHEFLHQNLHEYKAMKGMDVDDQITWQEHRRWLEPIDELGESETGRYLDIVPQYLLSEIAVGEPGDDESLVGPGTQEEVFHSARSHVPPFQTSRHAGKRATMIEQGPIKTQDEGDTDNGAVEIFAWGPKPEGYTLEGWMASRLSPADKTRERIERDIAPYITEADKKLDEAQKAAGVKDVENLPGLITNPTLLQDFLEKKGLTKKTPDTAAKAAPAVVKKRKENPADLVERRKKPDVCGGFWPCAASSTKEFAEEAVQVGMDFSDLKLSAQDPDILYAKTAEQDLQLLQHDTEISDVKTPEFIPEHRRQLLTESFDIGSAGNILQFPTDLQDPADIDEAIKSFAAEPFNYENEFEVVSRLLNQEDATDHEVAVGSKFEEVIGELFITIGDTGALTKIIRDQFGNIKEFLAGTLNSVATDDALKWNNFNEAVDGLMDMKKDGTLLSFDKLLDFVKFFCINALTQAFRWGNGKLGVNDHITWQQTTDLAPQFGLVKLANPDNLEVTTKFRGDLQDVTLTKTMTWKNEPQINLNIWDMAMGTMVDFATDYFVTQYFKTSCNAGGSFDTAIMCQLDQHRFIKTVRAALEGLADILSNTYETISMKFWKGLKFAKDVLYIVIAMHSPHELVGSAISNAINALAPWVKVTVLGVKAVMEILVRSYRRAETENGKAVFVTETISPGMQSSDKSFLRQFLTNYISGTTELEAMHKATVTLIGADTAFSITRRQLSKKWWSGDTTAEEEVFTNPTEVDWNPEYPVEFKVQDGCHFVKFKDMTAEGGRQSVVCGSNPYTMLKQPTLYIKCGTEVEEVAVAKEQIMEESH